MSTRYAGKKWQGTREERAYRLDTAIWGGYDSDETVILTSAYGGDVSDTHLSGDPSVTDGVITTPLVVNLAAGTKYTLHIGWKHNGNTCYAYCYIIGEE